MTNHEPPERVVEAERALLQRAVRADHARLEALLHPGFREIGASGRLFDRATIMAELEAEEGGAPEAVMTEIATELVADDLVLLTYLLQEAGRTTRRSSLWRLSPSGTRIVFHQGTVVT